MTALAALSQTDRRRHAADRLWLCATALLALMPVIMAVASRSSPLVITLAAVSAATAAALEGHGAELVRQIRTALANPPAVAGLAFLAWSLVSVSWSREPGTALHALAEFVLPVGAALVLALALPPRAARVAPWLLAAMIALACAVILTELATNLALRHEMGFRSASYIFNRPVLTILVLLVPLVRLLTMRSNGLARATAGTIIVLSGIAILMSESGAAALGLMVGGAVFVLARVIPRTALALAALGFTLAFALAPVLGDLADRVLPPSLHKSLAQSHSRERVDIWRGFDAVIREEPWTGAGFGMSIRLDQAPIAARIPPELRSPIGYGHPHNAALQVWVELGAVGAVLALTALLLILRAFATLPADRLAPRLALVAAIAAVSLVGHGAWQGWWPAAIGASLVWLRIVERETVIP